jgi:putative FmdB family regulatory protein
MPLYEYNCRRTGLRVEVLRKYDDRTFCPCGCNAPRIISAPAKTAFRWGDSQWDGRYDRGLGVKLRDRAHREHLMAERGLRELQPGEVEAEQRRVSNQHDQHEQNIQTYQRVLEDTGSTAMAMAQTFPNVEV